MKTIISTTALMVLLALTSVKAASVTFLANYCYSCTSPDDASTYYFCPDDNKCYDSSSDTCVSGLISTGKQCKALNTYHSSACDTLNNIPIGSEATYDLTIHA